MSDKNQTFKTRLSTAGQSFTGKLLLAPGEFVEKVSRLDRRTLAWGALALAGITALALNLAVSQLFRDWKADVTKDRLYTISNGTRAVLAKIDEPINIRVYYTRKLGDAAPQFGKHFERVKALLEQYRDISGGKLQITFLDPEPFSDAEDRAVAAGLKGARLNQDGETAYFGLTASNTTDNDAVIEFFALDRERFIEYDLTKLVHGLSNPKKRVVGIMAGINMDGGANPMQPMRQPAPPWMVMEQIRDFFEVRTLQQTDPAIPPEIDVLLLVQPTLLTAEAAYAVDQFALAGGKILAFVDPVAEASPSGPQGMPGLPISDDMKKLLKSWGVAVDDNKIAGDPSIARRVQFNSRGRAVVTEYPAWLQIDKGQINDKDPLAAGIERLHLATAGALAKVDGATTIVQPLIETTTKSGFIDVEKVRFQPDPLQIMRAFQSDGKRLMLAARIGGEAKSAFPDGRPKPAEKSAEEKAKDDEKKSLEQKVQDKVAEQKAKELAAKPQVPHVPAGRVNIIVVADSDMLHDSFWVEVRDFLGQKVALPQAHNAAFVVNALENLSGGEALAGLRGRGISERPFELVQDIRRDAEQRFRQKEEGLMAKLKELQEKLARIQTKGGEGGGPVTAILSDKDKQSIDQFRGEMVTVRRELRDVKAALRRDIDHLDRRLKFWNIAAVPLLIAMGGLAVAFMRRRRQSA